MNKINWMFDRKPQPEPDYYSFRMYQQLKAVVFATCEMNAHRKPRPIIQVDPSVSLFACDFLSRCFAKEVK